MRHSRGFIQMKDCPGVVGYAAVGGKREAAGPLGRNFDKIYGNEFMGEKTFEKAESRMQKDACTLALEKSRLTPEEIDLIYGGDLLNQLVGAHYGLREFQIPFIGLYGACSTMALSIIMASLSVDTGFADYSLAVTSSHFCSAERQFRYPLEYGGQRPPTSQCTATASGAAVLGKGVKPPYVKQVYIGTITDLEQTDINNMGAAMAPAAARTLKLFFDKTQTAPDAYDLIVTGDLGKVGSELLVKLLKLEGIDISGKHKDCGLLLYDIEKQDVHSGGSGCGCSAAVLCSTLLKRIEEGQIHNMLFVATGALMSTITIQQGETIPGIAHLVHFSDSK